MKKEKECLCYQEVKDVCKFNLLGIFVLSQATILSELTHNLMNYCHVVNIYKLPSLVAKWSILYFADFLDPLLGK